VCGLAGIFETSGRRPVDERLLRAMTTALAHRGPDGDGFLVEPGVGLGHRRLAIIDLSSGDQPIFNEDGSVAVVFNGEIYDFARLRTELEALGHTFRTRSDTETIVHAWESWGPACVEHLSGMFVFALWDRKKEQLFLARDRLGKKPLYYMLLPDGQLAFASELCGLAAHPRMPRRLAPEAIADYLAYGYVQSPGSIFAGVAQLPAAHSLLVERGRPLAAPRRYWRPHFAPDKLDEAEAAHQLVERLRSCVEKRLVADVPLGAFLSGGVDSSAVVALMAGLRRDPIATFTIGFDGESDETGYAAAMARRYATAHHSERTAVDYVEAAREQARIFGEPFADSSSIPTHRVSALARRDVTVALSGDGGDELFAGYRRYRWHLIAEGVRRFAPGPLRQGVFGTMARLYPKLDRAPRWLRAKHTLTEISLDSALGYYRTLAKVHEDERRRLMSPALREAVDGHDPAARVAALMAEAESDDPLAQARYVDLKTYLVDDILTKVDRASMAVSLETRAPLLDHTFVEWVASLPSELLLHGGEGKYVFKRALEGLVPRDNLYRAKQGFAMPLQAQLREAAPRLRQRLLGAPMLDSGWFDQGAIRRLIDEHAAGARDWSQSLWPLLVFEGFLAANEGLPAAAHPTPVAA
jgi:asparagine synthase (glutamine-hydrolysing)